MDDVAQALRHTWPISSKLGPESRPDLQLEPEPSHD
jgi:hypothetical protein